MEENCEQESIRFVLVSFVFAFFFARNIRIIPVQASKQKSYGKVFPTFFHFS